jgi:hypothetical protein
MKWDVTMHAYVSAYAFVSVEAGNMAEAKEKARALAPEAEWTIGEPSHVGPEQVQIDECETTAG